MRADSLHGTWLATVAWHDSINGTDPMKMSGATVLGALLIVAGAIGLVVRGIEYTRTEKIIDIGPIEASAETQQHVAIPVWVSALVLGAGLVVVVSTASRRA
jgi:hypothetical protein